MASTTGPDGGITSGTRMACRIVKSDDEAAVVALLCEGFPERSVHYWTAALTTLGRRPTPEGFPRYGFCLTTDQGIVGVILLIHSVPLRKGAPVRCYVSSWFVRPPYRIYASALAKVALKRKDCVYINMSAAAHTRTGLAAQGYFCYARGQFLSLPALGRPMPSVTVRRVGQDAVGLDVETSKLLRDHAAAGCISLSCAMESGDIPFVFMKRKLPYLSLSCAQLIYCPSLELFTEMQGPVGRYLLRMGLCCVMLDANGPVHGLKGHYFDGRMPKYFKGSQKPRLGDLSYSEAVIFGP